MTDKKTLSLFLLIFLPVVASAQPKETILRGYLGVEGGDSYTYQLIFTDSAGYIKGNSYTYLYENKEVKAAITGNLDKKSKTLAFKETSIIYNHGFESNTTICLINALLRFRTGNDGNEIFAGAITSNDVSNVYCGQGTVSFPVNGALKDLFSKDAAPPLHAAEHKPEKPIRFVYDTVRRPQQSVPQEQQSAKQITKITEGVEKILEWQSDSITIRIWDGGRVDGDVVSVLFNGSAVLSNYRLMKAPKILQLLLSDDAINTVTVIAQNEGNEPPNSADMALVDGSITYPVIAYNSTGKSATVKIKKAKK